MNESIIDGDLDEEIGSGNDLSGATNEEREQLNEKKIETQMYGVASYNSFGW
jgi:hypothetical protein